MQPEQYNHFRHVLLTNLLVFVGSLQLFEAGNAAQQGTAPTGHNPFLHSCPSGVESVCNTVLLLIHLDITGSTNLNQCRAHLLFCSYTTYIMQSHNKHLTGQQILCNLTFRYFTCPQNRIGWNLGFRMNAVH